MTNKEAIGQLKWAMERICKTTYSPETFEAINLAIKALEERPQGDLISREALKKTIEPYRYAVCGFECVLALIDNAPTVEADVLMATERRQVMTRMCYACSDRDNCRIYQESLKDPDRALVGCSQWNDDTESVKDTSQDT